MYKLLNEKFTVSFNKNGRMTDLTINDDPVKMNWLINEKYLQEHNYKDDDKLFGCFQIKVNGSTYDNYDSAPKVISTEEKFEVKYVFTDFTIILTYSIKDNQSLSWSITCINDSL